MPTNPTAERVGDDVKNALYASIGLAVLAVQKVQVQRRQLTEWMNEQTHEAGTSFAGLQTRFEEGVKTAEERLSAIEDQAEAMLTELRGHLPEQVKTLAEQAVDYATQARTDLVERVGATAAKVREARAHRAA